jgi:hypothetical protein
VNEDDWLKSMDPGFMLAHLGPNSEGRKLRLFACACCRRIWGFLEDERSKRAVEVAEAFADWGVSKKELAAAARAAEAATEAAGAAEWAVQLSVARAAELTASQPAKKAAVGVAAWAAEWAVQRSAARTASAERQAQADLVRCIFGNPFRPAPPLDPAVPQWNGGAVLKLAEATYQERTFDRLPILADALEEAGCTDPAILDHCRSLGPHARGCFVLDLILRPQPRPKSPRPRDRG